jgi:hypothetical protein
LTSINLASPARARELAHYLAIRRLVIRAVQLATPSYQVLADGSIGEAEYRRDDCGPCGFVRHRLWLHCPLHRGE